MTGNELKCSYCTDSAVAWIEWRTIGRPKGAMVCPAHRASHAQPDNFGDGLLVNETLPTDSEVAAARAWIADCEWADMIDAKALTYWQIYRGIRRHYDGGWAQFRSDGE